MPELITLSQAAKLLSLSPRRVRMLCADGRIVGAELVGPYYSRRSWVIPSPIRTVNWPAKPGPKPKQVEKEV